MLKVHAREHIPQNNIQTNLQNITVADITPEKEQKPNKSKSTNTHQKILVNNIEEQIDQEQNQV